MRACEVARNVIAFPGASQRAVRTSMARQLETSTAGLSEHAASAVASYMREARRK